MIDLDDLLVHVFGEAVAGRLGRSRRVQLLLRMFFGLIGAALGLTGAVWMLAAPDVGGTPTMRLAMAAMFLFTASFFGANVMLARRWRWPAVGVVASFISLFVVRIAFGP